jgi:hypothetical protein
MKVMLRLRDLNKNEASVKEFESVEAAIPWLQERPRFVEVLGVVFEGLTHEDNTRLKAAMRPLDDEEHAKMEALDELEALARAQRAVDKRREAEEQSKLAQDAAKKADPNRPMELRYRYNVEELAKTDQFDDRPITKEATDAVLAWVHERMEWVADRGQTVGEAKVTVYPNDVPAKKSRVVNGSFVPVTAPAKGQN